MVKACATKTLRMEMRQYVVSGRRVPTEAEPAPKVYRMTVFARDELKGKSMFWKHMRSMAKVKRSEGQLLGINEVREKKAGVVKNFGIWYVYRSRHGTHNAYKEFRDMTLTGAVGQLYMDNAGRHRTRLGALEIIRTTTLKDSECKRSNITQYHGNVSFPAVRCLIKKPKAFKKVFSASRPLTVRK